MEKAKNRVLSRAIVFILMAAALLWLILPFLWKKVDGSRAGYVAEEGTTVVETVYDLLESTYQIQETGSGKVLSVESGLTFEEDGAGQIGVIRYGDFYTDDELDNVPVALTVSGNSYLSLAKGSEAGTAVRTELKIAEDASQRFLLQKSTNWTESHLAYKIYHPLTKKYLSVDSSGKLQSVDISPKYDFVFKKVGDTELGKVRTLPGYQKLTAAEQTRLFDCLGGIGAQSLWYYKWVTWGDRIESFGNRQMVELKKLYENSAVSADDQVKAIRALLKNPVIHEGQTGFYLLPDLPGVSSVTLEKKNERYIQNQYFWEAPNNQLPANKYELTISDSNSSQTMSVAVHDNDVAKKNELIFLEAIKRIPYPLRRYITKVYIFNSNKNQFNCNNTDLHIRLSGSAGDALGLASILTHEFGHSMDKSNRVTASGKWKNAIDGDIVQVSPYGNTSKDEDIADFGRLYFQCYGNINRMYGIRQLFPNRYKEYMATLQKAGYRDIYDDILYGLNTDFGNPNPIIPPEPEDPKVTESPEVTESPAATLEPDNPEVTESPAATSEPDNPEATESPVATLEPDNPEVTESPAATSGSENPEVTKKPDTSPKPENPEVTGKPIATLEPEKPKATIKPPTTPKPGNSGSSGNSGITVWPVVTLKPEESRATAKPTVTPSPKATKNPIATAKPTVAPKPKPTAKPMASSRPKRSETKVKAATSPKPVFSRLTLHVEKVSNTSNKLRWRKVSGARYMVFGSQCNSAGKKYKLRILKKVGKNITSYTHRKLKKGTYYKYVVWAYKKVNGKKKILSISKPVHSVTMGGNEQNWNLPKSNIRIPVTLSKGKKLALKFIGYIRYRKAGEHQRISYESSNRDVAVVSARGIIRAKKKGSCYIYMYAPNGIYKRIKLIVE